MRKLISILFIIFLFGNLISCASRDAMNTEKCLESVVKVFPNSKIYKDLDYDYRFYVVDSTGVKLVKTVSLSDAGISSIEILLQVK